MTHELITAKTSLISRHTLIAWIGIKNRFFTRLFVSMILILSVGTASAAELLSGLGGNADYGELAMTRNDDGSSGRIDLGAGFTNGINFFGTVYTSLYINNNGNITFSGPVSSYTPVPFPVANRPMIAPYWGDVDTRGSVPDPIMNNVYYHKTGDGQFIVTWYEVGYYPARVDKLNSFQLVLTSREDVGLGDLDVEFRYNKLQWTTGNASGGSNGLGGVPAQVGFDAGDQTNFYAHPESMTGDVLKLVDSSNVGEPGVWRFEIRNGVISEPPVRALRDVNVTLRMPAIGLDINSSSFALDPMSIETVDDQHIIRWYFSTFSDDQLELLDFDVIVKNPQSSEVRTVSYNLDLTYVDINGNEVQTVLGEYTVDVLPSIFELTAATDRSIYRANESVAIFAQVANLSEFDVSTQARFLVKDSQDMLVVDLGITPIADLNAGEQRTVTGPAFTTGNLFEGNYKVHVELIDDTGAVLLLAMAPFSIITPDDQKLTARIMTDKSVYTPVETIAMVSRVTNTSINAILNEFVATTIIYGPDEGVFWSNEWNLRQLLPGQREDQNLTVALSQASDGQYRVELIVTDNQGIVQASDMATVTIQSISEDGTALEGTLTAKVKTVYTNLTLGEHQVCTDVVTYAGTTPLTNQPIRQLVVRMDDETPLKITKQTLDLAPGTIQTLIRSIDTAGFEVGDHACVLQANIADQWQTLDAAVFTVTEPPVKLDGQLNLGERGRVLILLDDPSRHGGRDPHGPDAAPTLDAQRSYLETLLNEADWSYTITTTADAFTTEFRSGDYQTYLILSEHIKLPEQVQAELREAVFRGEGLIVAGGHDQRNGRLDEPLGINYKGKTGKPNQLRLLTSPLHPASDIDLRTGDNVQRAQLQGARAAGYFGAASNTHHSPAPAIDLGPAAPYNVLVFGDFSAPYADVEGRLAAGGDVSLNHYSVGAKLASSSAGDVLLVGGDLTFPSGRVYHGNIRVGGSAAGVGDPVRHGLAPGAELSEFTTLPMDFTSAEHTLKALSDDLARLPANGSAEFRWGGLTLHGDGHSALQVFTLDGAQVLQAHTFQVDGLPKEATVLFNITGTHPGLTHMSLDSLRYHRERTLFNFFEARTLTLAGIGVEGSILAPWATVTNPEGVIKGTLVAQAFDGALQLNHHPFLGHPSGDQDLVAVTTHDYGVGRSVYAGFDLLSEATVAHAPVFAKLLLNALKTVQPVDTLPVSGAVLPVHLGITNQGMATPVVVSLMASPADIRVVDALASRAETTSPATDQQRWVFALPESAEATLTTWWRLPDWEGLVTFDALVQTGSDPNLVDHALLSVDTDVQPRPTLSDAQAELMRLAAMDRTFDKVLKKLNKAAAKWSGGQVQYALKELLKVTEELARLAQPEAAEARRLVAQVLATVARQTLD